MREVDTDKETRQNERDQSRTRQKDKMREVDTDKATRQNESGRHGQGKTKCERQTGPRQQNKMREVDTDKAER